MILIAILVGIIAVASWRQRQIKESVDPSLVSTISIPENFEAHRRGSDGRDGRRDGRDHDSNRWARHYPRYPYYPRWPRHYPRYPVYPVAPVAPVYPAYPRPYDSWWGSWWPTNWNWPGTCDSYASQKCLNAADYSDCYRIHKNQCLNAQIY